MRSRRPLRILMTTDTLGGVWTYTTELVPGLARQGVQVVVASMGDPPTPAQRHDLDAVPGVRLAPSGYRLEWMPDAWDDVAAAGRWLLELEEEVRPDVIHLNGYAHGSLPFRAPVLVVGHSCVCSWWEAVHGEPAPADRDRYRREVARGLRAAATVVAPTRTMLQALERHHGPLPDGRVVPNGRGPARPRGPSGPLGHRGTRDPRGPRGSDGPGVVLACGRLWDEAKNLAVLERVAPRLPWPIQVAGACHHADGGTAETRHVEPLGRLDGDEMARHMAGAPVFVHPALYEPFGLAPLEAALAGCALVLGDIPSLREVWGPAADFADPTDPDAVHRALLRLIRYPELRRRRAAAARRRALELSPEVMVRTYLGLYRELAGRRAARGPVPVPAGLPRRASLPRTSRSARATHGAGTAPRASEGAP